MRLTHTHKIKKEDATQMVNAHHSTGEQLLNVVNTDFGNQKYNFICKKLWRQTNTVAIIANNTIRQVREHEGLYKNGLRDFSILNKVTCANEAGVYTSMGRPE